MRKLLISVYLILAVITAICPLWAADQTEGASDDAVKQFAATGAVPPAGDSAGSVTTAAPPQSTVTVTTAAPMYPQRPLNVIVQGTIRLVGAPTVAKSGKVTPKTKYYRARHARRLYAKRVVAAPAAKPRPVILVTTKTTPVIPAKGDGGMILAIAILGGGILAALITFGCIFAARRNGNGNGQPRGLQDVNRAQTLPFDPHRVPGAVIWEHASADSASRYIVPTEVAVAQAATRPQVVVAQAPAPTPDNVALVRVRVHADDVTIRPYAAGAPATASPTSPVPATTATVVASTAAPAVPAAVAAGGTPGGGGGGRGGHRGGGAAVAPATP